jgi:hypothetical protein
MTRKLTVHGKYLRKIISNTVSSKDYGPESQRTIRYRPTRMTFREYDKMITFHPGLKYWNLIFYHEWEKLKPRLDPITGRPITLNGVPQMDNHYTDDEINELQMTDRIAVSPYVQGNGPETDTYTDNETAYEIRAALRELFENINTLGLTELVAKFYEVVKLKGN